MRLDEHPTPRVAELDSTGRFVISGLADVDYCVEIVVRTNPALVLARKEFVRPGGDELVLTSDPSVLFGPEAKAEEQ
jgi:hypothetical protein